MKRILVLLVAVILAPVGLAPAHAKPLKVYILAGQSNMEGHAKTSTFDYVGMDPKTAPMLKDMRNADGSPIALDDVYISYLTGFKKLETKSGPLTVGYGALAGGPKIGPEYTFGIYMHKALGEPILLIKTAWGGKSLHTDFRPPSAGPFKWPEPTQANWDKHPDGAHGIPAEKDRPKWWAEKQKATGHYYRLMIEHVREVTKDIKKVYPDYDPADGYELAGFVWFQGWNDMVDRSVYPGRDEPDRFAEYSKLFAHFIRDVRKDLNAPDLPFVIGVMGVGGDNPDNAFQKAMAAPAKMDEFKGTVTAVRTGKFWDHELEKTLPKGQALHEYRNTAHALNDDGFMSPATGWELVGKPGYHDRVWRYTTLDPTRADEKKPIGDARRFRNIALPDELADWMKSGFDDSKWKTGKAPIGLGEWKHRGETASFQSDWGDGEFILMRTTFDVDKLDYEQFRISVLARNGFRIYLNGEPIHQYVWWKDDPKYRSIILGENEIKHLKKGKNVLAVYANWHADKRRPEPFNAVDVAIEGIAAEGLKAVQKDIDALISPKEREIIKGASNGGYHYLGSAKILGQIGKAFAEAMVKLEKE
jgi:hypothetical protein